jgi:Flp pilus assembly protein TadG
MPKRPDKQGGTAAIEFLIAVPLLLLLLIGVSEFGRILYQYNTLTKSTRDAARYLSANARWGSTGTIVLDSTDITETRNLVVYGNTAGTGDSLLPNLVPADVSVSCFGGGTNCPGVTHIVVTTQYAYQPILGDLIPTFGLSDGIRVNIPLTTSSVMHAL